MLNTVATSALPKRARHYAETVSALGNIEILSIPDKLALFCSRKCPGSVVREVYDFAYKLRANNRTVIGGFQTPLEKECLRVFLNSSQNIVICPARSLDDLRIPGVWKTPIEQGRILLISHFPGTVRRVTSATAESRNRFAADLADEILFAHAAPGSSTERLSVDLHNAGRKIRAL